MGVLVWQSRGGLWLTVAGSSHEGEDGAGVAARRREKERGALIKQKLGGGGGAFNLWARNRCVQRRAL